MSHMSKIRGESSFVAPMLTSLLNWLTLSGQQFPTCLVGSLALLSSWSRDGMAGDNGTTEEKGIKNTVTPLLTCLLGQ